MTNIVSSIENLVFIIQSIVIILLIDGTLNFIFKRYLSNRIRINEQNRARLFWIYTASLLFIISLLITVDTGILNDLKLYIITLFMIFVLGINTLVYLRNTRLRRHQFIRAMIFLIIIWLFLIPSIFVSQGFYFSSQDHIPEWKTKQSTYLINNVSYNISVQVITILSTYQGFFIETPFLLTITEGFVKYNEEPILKNSSIEVKLKLHPHAVHKNNNSAFQYLTTLQTKFDGNSTYKIIPPKDSWILYYIYSGEKEISSIVIVDGVEVKEMERVPLVEIEKGYVKTQVETSRAIIILTLWIIFLSLFPIINRIIDWLFQAFPTRFMNDEDYFYH